jgi:hypothetical protein
MGEPDPSRAQPEPRRRVPLTAATVAAILGPGLVIFVYPMVSLIARNQEYFRRSFSAGRSLYLAGLVTVAIGASLWASSLTRVGRLAFTGYVLLTPAWILYSGIVSWDYAAVLVIALVVATTAYLAWRPRPTFFPRAGWLAALLVVVGGLSVALEVQQSGDLDAAADDVVERRVVDESGLPNVYHIVLDEFQTEMLEVVLDDRVREDLAGFTWYTDAQTTWGRTEMSMASTLSGADYDLVSSTREYVEASLYGPTSSLTELRALGYEVTGYYNNPSLYRGDPPPFDHRYLAPDAVAGRPRGDYRELATSLWAFGNLPRGLAESVLPADRFAQLDDKTLLPHDIHAQNVANYESFVRREPSLPGTGRYELVHVVIPHVPYELSPLCEYQEGVETDAVQQVQCALLLVDETLDQLAELDRFDDSVVIIHGDHGAGLELAADGALVPFPPQTTEWHGTRARSLLLVKPAGVDRDGELQESAYPALLSDIMPTVFDSIGADVDVPQGRTSLLADDLPERPEREYYFYRPGPDDLPAGEVEHYTVRDGAMTVDEPIPIP